MSTNSIPSVVPENTFDVFVRELQNVTGLSKRRMEWENDIPKSTLSNKHGGFRKRETATYYIKKLHQSYLNRKGFSELWGAIKPDLDIWLAGLSTQEKVVADTARVIRAKNRVSLAKQKNPFDLFVDDILDQRRDLSLSDLERIKGLSHIIDIHRTPCVRELMQRKIYLLAPIHPPTYVEHKERLDVWVENMKPLSTKTIPEGSIGFIARQILSRSFVEKGMTEDKFAELCGTTPTTFRRFLAGKSSWDVIKKCSSGFGQHASPCAWFEMRADYFEAVQAHTRDDDKSVEAIRHSIHDDWCGMAVRVLKRAVELEPKLAQKQPARGLLQNSRIYVGNCEPHQLDIGLYRAGLQAVVRQWDIRLSGQQKEEPLLPVHLHNTPTQEMKDVDILPQAKWLLGVKMPPVAPKVYG